MRLNKALKEKIFDIRLRDKLISEGKITKKEVETYYNELSDEGDNYVEISQRPRNKTEVQKVSLDNDTF